MVPAEWLVITGGPHEHDLSVARQALLVAVVETLVIPRLDQAVETSTICATLHNLTPFGIQ